MFVRSVAILLVLAASVNAVKDEPDIDPPLNKDCYCEGYLKADAWDWLEKRGIIFPEFCCQIGFANKCWQSGYYSGYGSSSSGYAAATESGLSKAPIGGGYGQQADSYGYYYPDSSLVNCIEEVGLGKLARRYPDRPRYVDAGEPDPYGPKPKQTAKQSLGYGYQKPPPCYWSKDYYGYVSCIFAYYFKEAVQACYCHYRTDVHCQCKDCDKDVDLDVYVAYGDAETVCNQCPDHDKADPGYGSGGSGYTPPYGGGYQQPGYGYDHYLEGSPYDACAGYCALTDPFSTHYYGGYRGTGGY